MTKTVWLKEGTNVSFELGSKGSCTSNNGVVTVTGGEPSKLWYDNKLQAQAGGGQGVIGKTIADNNVTSIKVYSGNNASSSSSGVHWHSGNGVSSPLHSNSFPTLYGINVPGGCYVGRHVHDSYGYTCPRETCGGHMDIIYEGPGNGPNGYDWHVKCNKCGGIGYRHYQDDYDSRYDNDGDYCNGWKCVCNDQPPNVWDLGCGLQQGQILNITPMPVGSSVNTWNADSAVQSNQGDGKLSIELVEQGNLSYLNAKTNGAYYLNDIVHIMIMEEPKTKEHYAAFVKH